MRCRVSLRPAIERRSRSPLIDLSIFRRRTLTGANVIGFMLGFSPLRTGVGTLAIALTVIVASAASQALVTRLGVKPVLIVGLTLIGAGLAYYTQIPVNGSYFANLFPGFLLTGVGLGFSVVPVSIAALSGVTSREAGLASGLITTSQQIGGGLGLAILTTVSTTRTNDLLASGVAAPTALTDGFRLAFLVGVGFAALAVAATFVLLKGGDLKSGGTRRRVGQRGVGPRARRLSPRTPHRGRGCPRQESNLCTRFRKPLLYPLSYGGAVPIVPAVSAGRARRRGRGHGRSASGSQGRPRHRRPAMRTQGCSRRAGP